MTFNYDPDKAEEKNFICLPNGDYEIEIVNVEQKVSKAGNDMLELTINAYDEEGKKVQIFDYIVNPSGLWKLKKICDASSIEFTGEIEEQNLVGISMMAKVTVRKATDKYPERNQIADYLTGIAKTESATITKQQVEDVEVPF